MISLVAQGTVHVDDKDPCVFHLRAPAARGRSEAQGAALVAEVAALTPTRKSLPSQRQHVFRAPAFSVDESIGETSEDEESGAAESSDAGDGIDDQTKQAEISRVIGTPSLEAPALPPIVAARFAQSDGAGDRFDGSDGAVGGGSAAGDTGAPWAHEGDVSVIGILTRRAKRVRVYLQHGGDLYKDSSRHSTPGGHRQPILWISVRESGSVNTAELRAASDGAELSAVVLHTVRSHALVGATLRCTALRCAGCARAAACHSCPRCRGAPLDSRAYTVELCAAH